MMLMYFREIMLGKRKGLIIRQILSVLSLIYLALIKIRICGYRHHLLQTKRLPVRVISVGNLTVGGSGKTPAIIEIASLLKDAGKRVGILIRGYGSRYEHQQGVVADGGSSRQEAECEVQKLPIGYCLLPTAENAGDEACLLARNLPGIPVLAGKNRWSSGEYAVKEFGCDTLLLDDGFQHIRLYRDVDILLYDVSIPQQGLRLFPEGVLREPLYAAKRAQVIILTHTDMIADIIPCMNLIKGLNPGALILTSIHLPLCLIKGQEDMDVYPLSSISGKKILACSGIGCPESFEHSLRQFDPGSIIPLRFPDHYQYDSVSIARIEEMARGVDMIVTTEKDMIRLENEMRKMECRMQLFFLKMRLEIITPNWQEDLLRCLCSD